jgi:hypothetical protein
MTGIDPSWLKEPLLGLLGGQVSSIDFGQEIAIYTSTSPEVYIFYSKDRDPSAGDLGFITGVLVHQSKYIEDATNFLREKIAEDPDRLGIVPEDLGRINSGIPDEELQFLFRLDSRWEIQFAGIELEFAEELGVRVCFEGEAPSCVEDNAGAQGWFDTDTGELVEY